MQTLERIGKLFFNNVDLKKKEIKPEAAIESLGLYSLDKVEFLLVLEKEFNVNDTDRKVKL